MIDLKTDSFPKTKYNRSHTPITHAGHPKSTFIYVSALAVRVPVLHGLCVKVIYGLIRNLFRRLGLLAVFGNVGSTSDRGNNLNPLIMGLIEYQEVYIGRVNILTYDLKRP